MFLWNILQKPEDELVRKVFNAQKSFPVKDDFIYQIECDCDDLGIEFDEKEIKNTKKETFKKMVKEKMKESSHSYLLQEKEKLSKLALLSSHYGMKDYLTTDKLSLEEKQLLFNLRVRMIEVKCNFKSKHGEDLLCSLCQTNSEESQEHVLICPALVPHHAATTVQYKDIFDSLEKQIVAVKHWSKLMSIRKIKIKEQEIS